MYSMKCEHAQWHDDSQPYEESVMLKCNNCGVFKATDDPNPNYDPNAPDPLDTFLEKQKARIANVDAPEAKHSDGVIERESGATL